MYWIVVAAKKRLRSSPHFLSSILRFFLLSIVNLLPVNSKIIGHPKGFYKSSLDFYTSSMSANSINTYIELYSSQIIRRLKPKTVHETIDQRFLIGYLGSEFVTPPNFILSVINGRTVGSDGTIVTPDDRLLADVSIEIGVIPENIEHHSIFRKIKLPKVTRTNETIAVLAAIGGCDNYFHWMFDILPRIHLLQKGGVISEVDKFLINKLSSGYQTETLEILGIPNSKLIQSHPSLHIEAKNLIIPSLPGITGSMTKWACDFLRESFLLERQTTHDEKSERIYISRKNASYRRILNEVEVISILTSLGFLVVELEKLSVVEQAALMSSAEIVISSHGAGLTNLVFCSEGCKVIELFAPTHVNPCYRALCNLIGLEYWYLLGKGQSPQNLSINHLTESSADNIEIDISSLLKTLTAIELITMPIF